MLTPAPATAETLQQALLQAYQSNPTLTAARADLRATDENVPIARAAGLPNLGVTGGYTENVLNPSGSQDSLLSPARETQAQASASLPILSFGAVRNSVRAAKTRVEAGRANLRGTESDLFTQVVGAYMDVIRDEAIVALNQQNVHVLDINLQATQDRFQVGDLTRTDVAQSQARLALARSQLQTAQANLISSRENYVRLVGAPPGTLADPPALPNLPDSPDSAVTVALQDSPTLLAAQRASDATTYDIRVAKAGVLPKVSAVVGGNYFNYLGSFGAGTNPKPGQSGTSGTVGLALTLPLYQGGRPAAEVRQAQARRAEALEQVTEAERGVVANTRAAYAVWKSAQEVIASSQTAVSADKLSLEGVRAENSVGNRTILDILNAEQELLNAQVTLVTAQRDAYVAGFALLAAMGHAEAKDLGLDGGVLYNPLDNYNRVHHRLSDFGYDKAPQPIATGTANTPAQGAEVNRPLDPSLDTPDDTPGVTPVDSARPNPATGTNSYR